MLIYTIYIKSQIFPPIGWISKSGRLLSELLEGDYVPVIVPH